MTTSPRSQAESRNRVLAARPWLLALIVLFILTATFGGYEILERLVLASRLDMQTLHLLHIIRGIVSSLVLAGVVAWYVLRQRVPVFPPASHAEALPSLLDREELTRQHTRWFVHMRWIAAGVILALIVIAVPVTGMLPAATLAPLACWWAGLVLANLLFDRWAKRRPQYERQIVAQALVDLVVLTGLLNASGGIENPLYIAYLFHVIIAGILLPKSKALGITASAIGLFVGLVLGEYAHLLPHHTNLLFPHARLAYLRQAAETGHGAGETMHAAHDPLFVSGEAVSFVVVLFLTAHLTTLVMDRLHQSEKELERAARVAVLERQRLESVVHAAKVGMILMDPDLTVRWFSQRIGEWLHWDASTVGLRCPFYDSPDRCTDCLAARTLRTGRSEEAECAVPAANGGARYFRHATSPVRDSQGRVVQVVELVEDVTARKALEAEALHAVKMSVLGRMAAGIAHEIGNPLSSMATRLRLMETEQEPDFIRKSLALLRGQVGRIGRIVHGVSQFARTRGQEWTLWEVNAAVEEALNVVELDGRAKGILFRRPMTLPSPRVRGVRDQMVQVYLNLLLNAVEAMQGGGTISIETFRRDGEVGVTICDTGVGMDECLRARLFEPFFTTKPEGTGLGLSISYALVHAHGGRFEVSSEPGKGSCVVVFLPAAEAVAPTLEELSRG